MPLDTPDDLAHVRLGDKWFRLAEGAYAETGLRPMRRVWRSLFPDRQNVSGGPGIQNVRSDDLRWLLTSFAGGGGQRVTDPNDAASFRRYESSIGVDLSEPGQITLAKAMVQQGLTGGASSTFQGDTWSDITGTSTVVNTTDRQLERVGDIISTDMSLATGTHQIDLYAYIAPVVSLDGSDFTEQTGNADVGADPAWLNLKSAGTMVESPVQVFDEEADVSLTADFHAPTTWPHSATAHLRVTVYDKTADSAAATTDVTLKQETGGGSGGGGGGGFDIPASATATLTFKAKATHRYFIRVRLVDESAGATYVIFTGATLDSAEDKKLTWELRQGTTVQSSGVVDMANVLESQKVASVTQAVVGGPVTYKLRVTRTAGSTRQIIVDKAVESLIGLNDPRLIELGLADKIWLVDYSAGSAPALLYWKPDTQQWLSVATFGAAGGKGIALAHTDHYEYIALDDKKVYRGTTAAVAQLTTATTDPIVGLAYGGNRLFVLTESTANGTELLQVDPEAAPTVAPTSKYPVLNQGVVSDTDAPQRMAGTKNGVVWFANQGPDCWVYVWDGAAGVPLQKIPTGFRGRAIAHGNGLSWVGGAFPAIDSTGATRYRPAIFVVVGTDTGAPVQQLDVKLFDDDDAGTHIQAMQLYGSDLWVLTQVEGAPKKMRLWRVSLAGTPAAFLYQEVETGYDPGVQQQAALGIRQLTASANLGGSQAKVAGAWKLADTLNVLEDPSLMNTWTQVISGQASQLPQNGYQRGGLTSGFSVSGQQTNFTDEAFEFTVTGDSTIVPIDPGDITVHEGSEAGFIIDFDDVTPGEPFTFSCDARVKAGGTGAGVYRVGIYANDASNNRLDDEMAVWQTSTSFQRLSVTLPSLPAGTVRVRCSIRASLSQQPVSPATYSSTFQFRKAKLARSATDSTYTTPTTQQGSTLLAILTARYSGGITFTPPAGWTIDGARVDNASGVSLAVYKIENASPRTGNEIFTLDSARDATLTLIEVTGTAASGVVDQTATATGGTTTPSSGTTGVTSQASELEIAVMANQRTTDQVAPYTSGWTQERLYTSANTVQPKYNITSANATASSIINHAVYSRITTATEAAGVVATMNTVRQWVGKVLTLKAPAVAAAPSPNAARGLAVTWKDRILAWSNGAPYRESSSYLTSGTSRLVSSRYNFGLTERKLLAAVELVADIPDGCSIDLWYSTDEGSFQFAGHFTEQGRRTISAPGNDVRLRNLQVMPVLHTTDPSVTPTLYQIGLEEILQRFDKGWELLVMCMDENSVWRLDGQQETGDIGIAHLFSLAEAGGIVEFEDAYGSKRPEDSVTYSVTVETPDGGFLARGEAYVRVRLTQRE